MHIGRHIKAALRLTPDSPIDHVVHANLLLHGNKKEDGAAGAFEDAGKLKPKDAMETLDAAYAKSQLESSLSGLRQQRADASAWLRLAHPPHRRW